MGNSDGKQQSGSGQRGGAVEIRLRAAPQTPVTFRILGTEVVAQVTGRDSLIDTAAKWDIYGTDLGHMFWHKDALYMVFGDTFGARGLFRRKNWRSNTMARIADPDPRSGLPIEAMISGADGKAKELLHSRKVDGDEMTVIPTYGISVDGRMYLHYMSVRHWGEPGHWNVGHSGFAYSDDDGQNWTVPSEAVQREATGFEQVAFVRESNTLYTFGIPEGRFGGVSLRRVVPEHILQADAYEYWDGSNWVSELGAAKTIVPAPVGELSVAWSKAHDCWLMMYLDPDKGSVMLRAARQVTGPWSNAHVVASSEKYPGLYAPYIVPGTEIDGELYYTMSQWEPYNVFLMRTALERGGIATASADVNPAAEVGAGAKGTLAAKQD